ncbi:MAG: hypothetical protein GEU97_17810 [Actinophytocola sp.]|nr:hypothetical protein [Actinophytocola sp.]
MAEHTPPPDGDPGQGAPPPVPRWVRISLIVVALLVALVVVLQLTGIGGDHGPGRHVPMGSTTTEVVSLPAPARGAPEPHTPPADHHR